MSIFRNLLIANSKTKSLLDCIFLDCISFNGDGIIDTGIKYQTCTIKTKMSFDYNNIRMLHGWGEQAGEYWGSNISNNFELGDNTIITNLDSGQIHDIEIKIDMYDNTITLIIDNIEISRTGNGSIPNSTYTIGAVNNKYNFYGKIYSHSVRDSNGILIQYLQPCLDSNGIPCFYDKITGDYFYNKNNNILKYIGHEKIKELNTSGIYINTKVIPTLDTSFEIDTSIASNYVNGRDLFGSKNTSDNTGAFGIMSNSKNNTFGFYRWGNIIECILVDTLSHTYYLSNTKAIIDNIEYTFPEGIETKNNTYELCIGGFNNNGSIYPAPQKIKICKIWEKDILIRYLIPVLRADGMECMFDEVEQKYYERMY